MKLNTNELKYIINESCQRLLLEISNNAIETLLKRYNPYLAAFFNTPLCELNYKISKIITISDDVFHSYSKLKLKDVLRLILMNEFDINRHRGPEKYIRGIIRLACSEPICRFYNMGSDINRERRYSQLTNIVGYIYKNQIDMSEDLNGMSFDELNRTIGTRMRVEAYRNNSDEEGVNENYGDYRVIPIGSFSEAHKYANYTSWCVTQGENYFKNYTVDDSQFFFCLKDGYQSVPKTHKENCPLDDYGLSMVSVLVYPNGTIKHVTTRWNHEVTAGEDNPELCTFDHIEQTLGIPKKVFKQRLNDDLEAMDIKELMKIPNIDMTRFLTYRNMGDGYSLVWFKNRYVNILNGDDELMLDEWANNIALCDENYKNLWFVFGNNGYQLWDKQYGLMTSIITSYKLPRNMNKWFNYFKVFNEDGTVNVRDKNNKQMFNNNNITSIYCVNENQFYYEIEDDMDRINIADRNFKLLLDKWIDGGCVETVRDGVATIIYSNQRMSIIDCETQEFIGENTYDYAGNFKNGKALVELGVKCNYILRDGSYVFNEWFDYIRFVANDIAVFRLDNDLYQYMTLDEEIMFDGMEFVWHSRFNNEIAANRCDGKWYLLKTDGSYKLIGGDEILYIGSQIDGYVPVTFNENPEEPVMLSIDMENMEYIKYSDFSQSHHCRLEDRVDDETGCIFTTVVKDSSHNR
jgi:hypothetical protein